MNDICIIGKGIIGEFLLNRFRDCGLNICVISSNINPNQDNNKFYNIYDYIDAISIWHQKATGNITFPLTHELKELGLNVEDFNSFKKDFLSELGWINFKNYSHTNISLIKDIFENKSGLNLEFFITARNEITQNEILDRKSFDEYWQGNKTFLTQESIDYKEMEGKVIKINENDDFTEVFYLHKNDIKRIKAKKNHICMSYSFNNGNFIK